MKRVAICLLLLALVSVLTGCVIIPVEEHYDVPKKEQVHSVEIYDLREVSAEMRLPEGLTPVYTLQKSQLESFWKDLKEISFTDHIIIVLAAVDPSFSFGDWVVRINYRDGNYTLLSSAGYNVTFNAQGKQEDRNHWSCDDEEWEQFVLKYLPENMK